MIILKYEIIMLMYGEIILIYGEIILMYGGDHPNIRGESSGRFKIREAREDGIQNTGGP